MLSYPGDGTRQKPAFIASIYVRQLMVFFVSFETPATVLSDKEAFTTEAYQITMWPILAMLILEVVEKTYFTSECCLTLIAGSLVAFGKLCVHAYERIIIY